MKFGENSALLIVGHGSTVNPDSSAPTWAQARVIEERGIFREVRCAFWKEEPSLRDAHFLFDPDHVRDVYVVPNFISEGYFTQTVIPRELELSGGAVRPNGQCWHYCEPAGSHPSMTDMILARAREVAGEADLSEAALFIVGHGTALNDNSAVAAKREAERLRARRIFGEVQNAYMEEAPLIADWDKLTRWRHVIVVPFFVADGLHSYEDIPILLGIETESGSAAAARKDRGEIFRRNPHHLRGRILSYASSIGTDARFADAIVEQAQNARSVRYAG